MACGENYFSFRCEKCGNLYRSHLTCKRRTCQKCARVRSFQMVEMYLPVVSCFQWACLLTLTLKVVPNGNVQSEVDRIIASFRKLRRKSVWNAKDGIASIEIVKKGDISWYVHLHALIDSKWMDQKDLSDIWLGITGDSSIVDIRRVKGERRQALKEVLKYQTKIWELNEEDKEFVEKTFKHRRFIYTFGIKKPEKPEFKGMKCKICGGELKLFEEGIPHGRSFEAEGYSYPNTS